MLQRVETDGGLAVLDAQTVRTHAPWRELIDALRDAFRSDVSVPMRHHHSFSAPDGDRDNTLLLMPAWQTGGALGVKLVSVVPSNGKRGLPAISSVYVLCDATTGAVRAILEGGEITARRTAATSALAVDYLARRSARTLLIVGTGRLCRNVAQSHSTVRDIDRIVIWGRSADRTAEAVRDVADLTGLPTEAAGDLEAAVRAADIVTCVTLAQEPLVQGAWLRPGTHLDLIGGFTPEMREADDAAIRASEVYVDTLAGAPKEAGDIVQPLRAGILKDSEIRADLFGLCTGQAAGRSSDETITFFKSAGHALQDLCTAELVVRNKKDAA